MSGTVLDHWLVRGYLRELDAVMRGLPAGQARELREQITAHLDDALGPDASDHEVAATLSRLGSPADLAAEAGAASGSSGPRPALSGWRLATVIAVPAVIAALFGGQQISSDASNAATFGRDQHLAQLNAAVVRLTQNLEDERDLSAGYVARRGAGPVPVTLADARTATDAAARAVQADAAGVGAGYQPGTVQDLKSLLASLTDLGEIRTTMSSSPAAASRVISVYTYMIGSAITFSAAVGAGTDDTRLQVTVTTLAALLQVENEQSVQRAVLYAALSAQPPRLLPPDLTSLTQAAQQQQGDQTAFTASADTAEQQFFANTVSGSAVDSASAQETLAEAAATANPSAPLTRNTGLDAETWYGNISTTIDDTRKVADQAAGQITARANALNSNATKRLLLASIVTLLLVVLLIVTALARPLRKLVQMAHPSDGG